jgi:membrane protein YdbS with pleckstrin-like domain
VSEPTLLARFETTLATVLRLPSAGPEPPPGSAQVWLFRAAPRFLHYNLLRWGVRQGFAILGLAIGFGFISALPDALWFLEIFEWIGVALYLAQLPLSFAVTWLDYNRRWYLVTDRALRIREGVWTVHERTMSFANVQNLEVRQGPIARLLGLSSLEVRSAGGGGQAHSASEGKQSGLGDDLHVAHFRGVDNAREIRDLILTQLRRVRGAGLGDPDEERDHAAPAHAAPPVVAHGSAPDHDAARTYDAALAMLAEARSLRVAVDRA